MNLDEIKSKINAYYASTPGTESYERKWLCDRIEAIETERDALKAAAQAVVERWDSPLWKDLPATGNYINTLRAAIRGTKCP